MGVADHIRVNRGVYWHHGIDVGDGTVIHYTGEVAQKTGAAIQRTPLSVFLDGGELEIVAYAVVPDPSAVIDRALSRLGEAKYNLAFNNCEHFATWCRTGEHFSQQEADATAAAVGTVGTGAFAVAGIATVGATGTVAGLSGAGVMSGLATIGGIVGGGAVAGLGVIAAAPAVVTTAAVHRSLKDDEALPEDERSARGTGRKAAVGGSILGLAGSITAVSATGTAGLSAAGITSGLAGIGSVVGGGMVAGVAVTVALPAVAALAAGFGAYRLFRKKSSSTDVATTAQPPGNEEQGE